MRHALVLALLIFAACSRGDGRPAGEPEARAYTLSGFSRLAVGSNVAVTLRRGPFHVEAQSRDGDLSRLIIETRGDELSISSQSMFTAGRSPTYAVTITAPTWTAMDVSAGAAVEGADLDLADIAIDAATGASLTLSGACDAATINIASSAAANLADLRCRAATVDASGGASLAIYASETARVTASTGAAITVGGDPDLTSETSSGGVIAAK
jgi:hypothetical protein